MPMPVCGTVRVEDVAFNLAAPARVIASPVDQDTDLHARAAQPY
jgi:hypothetical protein